MRSLLLVAHGSRRAESNDEVRTLTARIRERAGETFDLVECAFLELEPPSIPEGIEAQIRRGSGEVVVVPCFVSPGTHVREDVPRLVGDKQAEHPEVRIRITSYLGTAPAFADLLLGLALD